MVHQNEPMNKSHGTGLYPHDYILKYTILPLIPQSVTPNMVTMLRFFLVAPVAWFIFTQNYTWGIPLFLFAALTDAIDGSLARVRNRITKWGMLYDPLADKLLIGATLLIIVFQNINFYLGILVIIVELVVIAGAIRYKQKGIVKSANVYGKTKMVLQVVGILLLLIALQFNVPLFVHFSTGTFALAVLFAIASIITQSI